LAEGTRFLPSDRFARAQALQWLFFEQYSHEPYVAVLKFWTYWGGLEKCRPEDIERWKTRGQAALEVMEVELRQRPFFVGSEYSIADIALYAYSQSAEAVGFRVGAATKAWFRRVSEQPGYFPIRPPKAG
jgi:glutathione S-transferase